MSLTERRALSALILAFESEHLLMEPLGKGFFRRHATSLAPFVL